MGKFPARGLCDVSTQTKLPWPCATRTHSFFFCGVANTQLNHWIKRMVNTRLVTYDSRNCLGTEPIFKYVKCIHNESSRNKNVTNVINTTCKTRNLKHYLLSIMIMIQNQRRHICLWSGVCPKLTFTGTEKHMKLQSKIHSLSWMQQTKAWSGTLKQWNQSSPCSPSSPLARCRALVPAAPGHCPPYVPFWSWLCGSAKKKMDMQADFKVLRYCVGS